MPKTKQLICIVCPIGCQLEVTYEGVNILNLNGYTCLRGKEYAINEITNPIRMLTSTVKVQGAAYPLLPVRTSKPIPKGCVMDCMKEINKVIVNAPIKIGDVIIKDILGTGSDIIATRDMD